jgi:hypothetical protein
MVSVLRAQLSIEIVAGFLKRLTDVILVVVVDVSAMRTAAHAQAQMPTTPYLR